MRVGPFLPHNGNRETSSIKYLKTMAVSACQKYDASNNFLPFRHHRKRLLPIHLPISTPAKPTTRHHNTTQIHTSFGLLKQTNKLRPRFSLPSNRLLSTYLPTYFQPTCLPARDQTYPPIHLTDLYIYIYIYIYISIYLSIHILNQQKSPLPPPFPTMTGQFR